MAHFGNGKMMPCVAGGVAVGIGLGIGLAHVWQPASCKAKAPSAGGPLTLKYWNGRGLMEVPRMLLKIAGVGFKDVRATDDDLATYEKNGADVVSYASVKDSLDSNLGRLPVIDVPGGSVGQSAAINFYIATECGLMGSSTLEAATVISIQEHLKELNAAFRGLMPYGSEPTEEAQKKFFETEAPAADLCGAADMSARSTRFLKWYAGRLEGVVGADGFAVGGQLTLADLLIYNAMAETLPESQAFGLARNHAWKREPFTSAEKTAAVLKACPKISKIIANVRSTPAVKDWLATRGMQRF